MAVNITEISNVYTSLLASAVSQYEALYEGDKIDAETYSQLVGQISGQLMQLSAELVQKQEVLDKDNQIKDAEITKIEEETNLVTAQVGKINKEALLVEQETTNKVQELDNLKVAERKLKSDISKNMMDVSAIQTNINLTKTQMLNDNAVKLAEKALIEQKTTTEAKQSSLIDKQVLLTHRQAEGFEKNMYKERAKMALETIGLLAQAEVTSTDDMDDITFDEDGNTNSNNPYAKIVKAFSDSSEEMVKWSSLEEIPTT